MKPLSMRCSATSDISVVPAALPMYTTPDVVVAPASRKKIWSERASVR
jgi:hypothetical protein